MRQLSSRDRAKIVACLVEGNSIRATVRITGFAKNTVTKLLVDLGRACLVYQDAVMQNLPCKRIEVDEIWAFCYSKKKNVPAEHKDKFGYGDVWTYTAIDADTKLIPTWQCSDRTGHDAYAFMVDLSDRLQGRVQLTTDGHRMYLDAVEGAFGREIDYAQIIKHYGKEPGKEAEARYSPATCTGVEVKPIMGSPDDRHISTSYVERANLTMRMGMRRFTRLTNAFSKKIENLIAAVSLHFMHYNFARPHKTLSAGRYPTTPAMAAGLTDHVWTLEEIVGLLEATEKKVSAN